MDLLMSFVGQIFFKLLPMKIRRQIPVCSLGFPLLLLLFNGMIVKFEPKPSWTLKITPADIHYCHKVGIWFIS